MNQRPFLQRVLRLMDDALEERISIREFAGQYENMWNFERNDSELTSNERSLLEQLFETVAWHSTVEEDLQSNPRFRDDEAVKNEIERVRQRLQV